MCSSRAKAHSLQLLTVTRLRLGHHTGDETDFFKAWRRLSSRPPHPPHYDKTIKTKPILGRRLFAAMASRLQWSNRTRGVSFSRLSLSPRLLPQFVAAICHHCTTTAPPERLRVHATAPRRRFSPSRAFRRAFTLR